MSAEKRGPKKRRSNNTSLLFEATGAVSTSKLQGRRDPKQELEGCTGNSGGIL